MNLKRIPSLHEMGKNWPFLLLIITVIAIIIRSLPAWTNAAWGCDFGIYYGLTNSLIESGGLYNTYYGWGGSYEYFPVLFAITGIAHWITGLDVITIMPKIAPIFGGLSVLIFYFVVNELIGDKKKALLASLFLAVLPFHAYQTSQAGPLTIGHFFLMLSIYFFIKNRKDLRYSLPLGISTMLLIMTHHLTTYIFLLSLIFIVFIENLKEKEWSQSIKRDTLFIFLTSGLTFFYWAFVATPVYNNFMSKGLRIGSIYIGSNLTIVLFYLMLFLMFGFIILKRKIPIFNGKKRVEISQRSSIITFLLTMVLSILVIIVVSLLDLPWGKIYLTSQSILYTIPFLIIFSFGIVGFRHIRSIRNGSFIYGWFVAIALSFLYGMITLNALILPHRHFEYIVAPLSILSIYGMYSIFTFDYSFLLAWKSKLLKSRQIAYLFVVVLLVTTNAASVYPSYLAWESLDESYETITSEDLAVISWMDENLDKNFTLVASDHRIALLAVAVGFNTTRDAAIVIWDEVNLTDYIDELYGDIKNYSRITHIIVDDIMKDNVVHIGFDGRKAFMTNESHEKFMHQPFDLVYRNATVDISSEEEIHWAELYAVNWTYIEKFYPMSIDGVRQDYLLTN